jgi:hypothetical protein
MSTSDTMHVILPLMHPSHDRNAFTVARTMANVLSAPLHVVAAGMQPQSTHDLAERLSILPEALDAVAIEEASGDMVNALTYRVNALGRAMVILSVRLHDEAQAVEEEPVEAIERELLEKISCPILIVPPGKDMSTWRLRKELLPQDGTPGCAAALAQIINQSSRTGTENLILRVAGANVGQPTEPGSLATPRYVDHPQYEWEAWSQEFLDRICGMGANLNRAGLRLMMATGEPAAEILRVAQEEAVDMIILPWHGTLGSGRAGMIKAVLNGTSSPVLLVPQHGSQHAAKGQ